MKTGLIFSNYGHRNIAGTAGKNRNGNANFSRMYLWHITAICLLFHSCKVMAEITMEQIIGRAHEAHKS